MNIATDPPHASASTCSSKNNRKWLTAVEFTVIALIFLADWYKWHHVIRLSKTPYILLIGWLSLRLRGLSWKSVGLSRPPSWKRALAWGVTFGLGMEGLELFVTQPILTRVLRQPPDLELLRPLKGDLGLLLASLVLTWTLAAFGEEMVYRGYLMNRVAGLLRNTRGAWLVSLIVVNVVFGFSHFYQGSTGWIENAIDGLLLGWMYLRTNRNLTVPIVAHGVADTLDVVLIFLGKYPGL